MIAAQLIAAHNATMECYRRAMIGEQTLEGRRDNLSQANKHQCAEIASVKRTHKGPLRNILAGPQRAPTILRQDVRDGPGAQRTCATRLPPASTTAVFIAQPRDSAFASALLMMCRAGSSC
jgi:hypothetical protein